MISCQPSDLSETFLFLVDLFCSVLYLLHEGCLIFLKNRIIKSQTVSEEKIKSNYFAANVLLMNWTSNVEIEPPAESRAQLSVRGNIRHSWSWSHRTQQKTAELFMNGVGSIQPVFVD